MEKSVFIAIEDAGENWWYVSRENFVIHILHHMRKPFRLLDVGFGTGRFISRVAREVHGCEITGIDPSKQALSLAKKKRIKAALVLGDVETMKYTDSFDVITCLDVVEHTDDTKSLKRVYSALKPGGIVIITVPAFNAMWCRNDDLSHHKRRYTAGELKSKLRKAGFRVELLSYWNLHLFLPILVVRKLNRFLDKIGVRKEPDYDLKTPGKFFNSMLIRLMEVDNAMILAGFKLPLGTSIFCIARKAS